MAGQHASKHLDETGPSAAPPNVPLVAIAKAMLFPLFFVVMFALCYISAFHAPTPQDVKLALVGPTQQTSRVADQIAQHSPGHSRSPPRLTSRRRSRTSVDSTSPV
ncbi:hypothetical protein [Rhodococcus tukisamuensis]|uniref:Uncharacterized protein n=1 Tax=Rhodococcus tukisamuensis TaxID=168276 RepID=A0A1G6XDS4_9NOCA|nr:hypothetical protein [Rhodococcus tukisamuensis]SDD76394.1 hypothetical protein SAMN05444580_106186 [Rhodococcus tukisamuensis]